MKMRTLKTGMIYDISSLVLEGWAEGDGTGTDGYSCWDYFDDHGAYRGPDIHGIEPIFNEAKGYDECRGKRSLAPYGFAHEPLNRKGIK